MKQYALFFIKQNERFVVKLYEPEILHCLIELGNNGFNKSVRIRLENITRLKQMLMLDENNYCWQMGGYMNNEERATMAGIVALTKYLVDIWRGSKCPDTHEYLFECKKCKYNELCAKLDELAKVVGK